MSNQAFNPQTATSVRAVTATSTAVPDVAMSPAPSAAQASLLAPLDYRFTVVGTQPVFIAYALPGLAAPNASIPADSATGSVLVIESQKSYTFQFPYGTKFAVIAPATGSTVYVTAGTGIAL